MPRLLKRPEAESDLDEIWLYIAQDNPHNADRFLDRLQERCWALADFPQMGTSRDDLKAGLRCQPFGNGRNPSSAHRDHASGEGLAGGQGLIRLPAWCSQVAWWFDVALPATEDTAISVHPAEKL